MPTRGFDDTSSTVITAPDSAVVVGNADSASTHGIPSISESQESKCCDGAVSMMLRNLDWQGLL